MKKIGGVFVFVFFFTSWALQSILDFQIFAGTILTFQEIHLQMSLSQASSNHCTYKLFTACWAPAIPEFFRRLNHLVLTMTL